MLDKLLGAQVVEVLGLARTGGQLALILDVSQRAVWLSIICRYRSETSLRVARQATLGLGHGHAKT
jgi:hypothetical protein